MNQRFIDTIPSELVAHVTEMCGAKGREWFGALPETIAELESQWKIRIGQPFPGIEYNFVAEAVTETSVPVVVKIAPPFETVEIFGEAKYLRMRDGVGAVRLLAEDRRRQAILLERVLPGEALHERFSGDPAGCIAPAVEVLKRILQPSPCDMADVPTLDEWFGRFRRSYQETEFPVEMAERALAIYDLLSSDWHGSFYIHGDYHPGNIVSATREKFLAIDPKGIVGQIGYDIAVFLINLERWQRTHPRLGSFLDHAVFEFAAAFNYTELEIREWVYVHMVIGAWWNFQDMPALYDPEVAMPAVWHL